MVVNNRHFSRVAALAEILTVLVAGNLLGLGLYRLLVPPSIAAGTAHPAIIAAAEGLLIFLRLGSAGAIGFALLYFRRGITPRQAGLTRNDRPLAELIRVGLLLGVVTTIPIALLFTVHALWPFGEGLDAWWTYPDREIDAAFWIMLLGTGVLIPPLVEEILTRGYQRHRLVESYGVMGGVVLTGIVFALSHTRYLATDSMLLLFLLCIVISSVSWTYLAQKTGSVIPSMVAHALGNGTATLILFENWIPLLVLLTVAVAFRRSILATAREFARDWRTDGARHGIWTGLVAMAALLTPGLALLPLIGRVPTLAAIGVVLLVVTLWNLARERTAATARAGS
jgi:membrane protease YdiL (CAAX protease family)